MDSDIRRAMDRMLGKDSWHRTAGIGQAYAIAKTGQLGQNSQKRQ